MLQFQNSLFFPTREPYTNKNMPNQKPPQQPHNPAPQSAKVPVQPAAPKPDKNVAVPKFDLLTEGYDPAKLKKR